ncbi:MAG: hypothetical protein E7304_00090 [Butyrivibrio sp.]|uniref:hypothetical protein n=1 Tax=Butyrivibrio sp. TaxID=28121 RepID=UPI001ECF0465|nr:hypothetical protein [Butyrivibrio sp.]MBE5839783.1 hypothetical protein [Butyrivibrio sp.]
MNKRQQIGITVGIIVLFFFIALLGLNFLCDDCSVYVEECFAYKKDGTEKSAFASNGEESYLCCSKGEEFYLYYVDKKVFRKLPYSCGNNERIIRMAVDDNGQCSLLVYSAETEFVDNQLISTITDEAARIDVIDCNGNIVRRYDGSFLLSSTNIPSSFLTHNSLVYAMNCGGEATIVNMADKSVSTIPTEGRVSSVDVYGDRVIVTYYGANRSYYQELSIEGEPQNSVKLPKSNCKYGVCKILGDHVYIYNKDEGVFEYKKSLNKIKQIENEWNNTGGIGFGEKKICVMVEQDDEYEFHFLTMNS